MGTNLFVEGGPSPVVLCITIPREARAFRDVSEISSALAEVDTILRRDWYKTWPSHGHRRKREVWLLQFRVDSPPSFQILADPGWLAVFVALLVGYKQGKESIRELHVDIQRLLKGIRGLSERQLELLDIAVRLTLERWMEVGEKESIRMAKRCRRIRQRLIGENETLPDIEVRDIDNKNRSW